MAKRQRAASNWKGFETDVARMFRSAGFVVEENVEYSGQEFDLVATQRQLGGFDVRIAVECKCYVERAVGNAEVQEFVLAFDASSRAHNLTWGMIVTNGSFSRQAHEAVRAHQRIKLLSFDSLENELLGARSYLESAKSLYHSSPSTYVRLRASKFSQRTKQQITVSDVEAEASKRLASDQGTFTILLGDFGSGKTTVSEHVHRALSERYLSGLGTPFPVILYLRTLEQHDSEDSFIESHLKLSSKDFGLDKLGGIQARHRVSFILDGFDEVATNASEDERMRLFSRVMKLTARAHSVMITSRPSYFNNLEELNGLVADLMQRDDAAAHTLNKTLLRRDQQVQAILDRQQDVARRRLGTSAYKAFPRAKTSIFFLSPLSKADILAFLAPHAAIIKAKHRKTPEQIYEFLMSVYDLTDLLTRPLLLDMFVELLIAGVIKFTDPDMEIGPAGLYHLYVNMNLERDWSVRRFLTPSERLGFARAAAIAMLEAGGSLEATYDSIRSIVERGDEVFNPERRHFMEEQIEGVVTDVRLCSFMIITPGDRVEFSHKSFMEYFVADVIVGKLNDRQPIDILRYNLNYEILYFLGSFCLIRSSTRVDLFQHLQHVGHSEGEVYRTNLKVALVFSERVTKDREVSGIDFARIRLAKKSFENCQIREVRLRHAQITDSYFASCEFSEFQIEGELTGTQFTYCSGNLDLACSIEGVVWESCPALSLGSGGKNELVISGSDIRGSSLGITSDCNFKSCSLITSELQLSESRSLLLEDCVLKKCKLAANWQTASLRSRLKLKNCKVHELEVRFLTVSADDYQDAERTFRGFSGVIIVSDSARKIQAFMQPDGEGVRRYVGWDATQKLILIQQDLFAEVPASAWTELESVTSAKLPLNRWVEEHIQPFASTIFRRGARLAPLSR